MSKMDDMLLDAASENHINDVKYALLNGANVNAVTNDEKGMTSLMFAAEYGNTMMIRFLNQHGANIDQRDYNGYTALFYAAETRYESINALLQAGADIDAKNNDGQDILAWAKEYSYDWVINFIESFKEQQILNLGIIENTNQPIFVGG